MTIERIQSLEKLGFQWQLQARSSPCTWEEQHQQLADFKEQFRHTNVPQSYAENKRLAIWVHNQRAYHKLFKAKKNCSMTRERIQSLEKLGFQWHLKVPWEEQRQQLVAFNKEFRHTNVPKSYVENNKFVVWVQYQRSSYKLFKAKKKSSMTRERIQSLEKLGFEWQLRTRPSSSSSVEKILLSTEDGYESDNSDFVLDHLKRRNIDSCL